MTIFNLLLILTIIILVVSIIGAVKEWVEFLFVVISVFCGIFVIIFGTVSITQPIELKKEQIRQSSERNQIIYQIETLTDEKDKVKLNEWILTYNDWVNDINTEKQVYGWFAWHRDFDMSEHTIIDLV